jgi:hypothetical protein
VGILYTLLCELKNSIFYNIIISKSVLRCSAFIEATLVSLLVGQRDGVEAERHGRALQLSHLQDLQGGGLPGRRGQLCAGGRASLWAGRLRQSGSGRRQLHRLRPVSVHFKLVLAGQRIKNVVFVKYFFI